MKKTNPLSKLCKLALALALALQLVPALHRDEAAASSNPCSSLPRICGYTYNAAENCCEADPRFDCYDVCF